MSEVIKGKRILEKKETFRITCLFPFKSINDHLCAGKLQTIGLCAHGQSMTLEDMNQNLIQEKSPFINIKTCKYCSQEDSIGVFDDDYQLDLVKMTGFCILWPNETESGLYEIKVVNEEKFQEYIRFHKERW